MTDDSDRICFLEDELGCKDADLLVLRDAYGKTKKSIKRLVRVFEKAFMSLQHHKDCDWLASDKCTCGKGKMRDAVAKLRKLCSDIHEEQ